MVTVSTKGQKVERVWMVKRALVAPAGMVILLGTLARLELLRNCTTTPPAGAGPLRVTVPVAVLPPHTVVGLIVSDWSVTLGAGLTVRVAVRETPPADAVIVTLVVLETARVETVKVALVVPAGTVTVLGTVATLGLLLLRFTTNPPDGAGAVRVTVPVLLLPPTTLVGFSVRLLRLGCVGPPPPTACNARYTFSRPALGAIVRPLKGW
jgi:hypothetical protein